MACRKSRVDQRRALGQGAAGEDQGGEGKAGTGEETAGRQNGNGGDMMQQDAIELLSDRQLAMLAGEAAFGRGVDYYREGMVVGWNK